MSVGEEAVLTVLGLQGASLGLVFRNMRRVADSLAAVL